MPRVPTRDSFSNVAGAGPAARFNSTSVGRRPAGSSDLAKFGETVRQSSAQLSSLNNNAQKEANELRANDALNQAREKALELTYNTDDGYTMLKGKNALERPDGIPLDEEYSSRLGESISEISTGLSNDHQRMMFAQSAGKVASSFKADLDRHKMTQFVNYHASVADGAMKISQQEAELFWNDPDKIDTAINGVENEETGERTGGLRQAIEQKARLTGMSDIAKTAEIRVVESGVHSKVVQSALLNENTVYAEQYFNQNRSKMTGKDILEVKKVLDDQVETNAAHIAVTQATRMNADAFMPNDFSRLANITVEIGANKPSTDEEVLAKRDELNGMLRQYGDVGKALAATNTSAADVDKAVKKAEADGNPSNWLANLPKKTQEYVNKGVNKFSAGGGAAPKKTKQEYIADALSHLPENASGSSKKKVTELAEKQYKIMTEALDQKADESLTNAQRALVENGGSFSELPANVRMDLLKYDPAKYQDASKFAKAIRESNEKVTNDVAYAKVIQDPLILANMSDAEFDQFLMTEFEAGDRDKIVQLRQETLSGTSTDSPTSINDTSLNRLMESRLNSMGVNTKPKAGSDDDDWAKLGRIQKLVRQRVYALQKAVGRKLSPEELEREVDNMFMQDVELEGMLYGTNTIKVFDLDMGDIPNRDIALIKDALAVRGNLNPSDDEILATYQTKVLRGNN